MSASATSGSAPVDGLPQPEEGGVLVERLADGVDELEPRAEVLVQRRACDPRPVGNLLDRRLVEHALGEELANGGLDLLAGLRGSLRPPPSPIRTN